MILAITGASGFIGQRLCAHLLRNQHVLRTIGRRPAVQGAEHFPWDAERSPVPVAAVDGADAVIHLAGEPVAQRWNPEVKRRIHDSRVDGTRNLVAGFSAAQRPPRVLISASAVGYYGDRGDEVLTETSDPGSDFLAATCLAWENAARNARVAGARVVMLRTGVVLGTEGGALKQMLTPFRAGVGGPIGSGRQWVSWIHQEDIVRMILFALEQDGVEGPLNATAPNPVRNADFAHALGHTLGRPAVLPAPVFALRLMFGEGAKALVASQRALPEAATRAGFPFAFPEMRDALEDVLK